MKKIGKSNYRSWRFLCLRKNTMDTSYFGDRRPGDFYDDEVDRFSSLFFRSIKSR